MLEAMLAVLVVVAALVIALLFYALRTFTHVQLELRGVSERVSGMEQRQGSVAMNIMQATSSLQAELSHARSGLTELRAQAQERAERDRLVADSVRRLETIIAGTYSKGEAGENILDAVFSKLPGEWQVRNFRVGNKTVEFALRLPNNRILPIDSKWSATALLEEIASCDDPERRRRLKAQIESVILAKAREVKKYLDPALTADFGIAAVPDAAYDLCPGVQCDCFEHDVVLVAYSMFIPYLMLVFQTVLKSSQQIDLEKLDSCLHAADSGVRDLQEELEGRFARSLVMLNNSRDAMREELSRISTSLSSVRINAGQEPTAEIAERAQGSVPQDESYGISASWNR